MKPDPIASGRRKAVNLSLDTGVVETARKAGVNLSQVSEAAIRLEWKRVQEARWREENQEWIAANNRLIEEDGIPLSSLRIL